MGLDGTLSEAGAQEPPTGSDVGLPLFWSPRTQPAHVRIAATSSGAKRWTEYHHALAHHRRAVAQVPGQEGSHLKLANLADSGC